MPELDVSSTPPVNPIVDTGSAQRFPPPWPGMPRGLEALSAIEAGWWGHRFAIDTPAYMTPAGYGEMIPLMPGDRARYVLIYPNGPAPPIA